MYYYLSASLPSLRLTVEPDMSVAEFDEFCAEWIPAAQMTRLKQGSLRTGRLPEEGAELPVIYAAFNRFDRYLRTRIAERRAEEHGWSRNDEALAIPPLELGADFDEVDFTLGPAAAAADPLEREKRVDDIRWNMLDELAEGHEFDFDGLCVYRLRLEILNKYRDLSAEAGRRNFNEAAERISRRTISGGESV